ncbi:DUF1062 domain-containing protein [Actinoplanes sp. G11-F43]|uniref:DUF1062 domain-containing protein n=1 Tax=Actinoplanes sp. G11-F43 TaxID=3424130 RepID=UPI003D342A26
MLVNWVIEPVDLPLIRRRCNVCPSDSFRPNGKFRINANHKLLDVWLLALCTGCGKTTKLTIMERTNVRDIPSTFLDRLHQNDLSLAAELLQDPGVRRRNRIALDWGNAWRLDTGGAIPPGDEVTDVEVRFPTPFPVRAMRVIAEGCGISRSETEKLVSDGRIVSATSLDGKVSRDFVFTLKH